jgi:hypothetical protein
MWGKDFSRQVAKSAKEAGEAFNMDEQDLQDHGMISAKMG